MKKHSLKVTKRTVFGKKLKKLRREGILPANIYGKDVKSTAIQVPYKDFEVVFKEAGETGIVEIAVDGETRPTLIHNVQYDYVTHNPVHADFYQVNLKEKVTTKVPVIVTGEPKAVADKLGLLLQTLNEVEVEALPSDLPENIEIDVTHLAAVDEAVTVADLKKPTGVDIITPAEEMVAKIAELVTKEAEAEAAAETAAAEGEEATEGEAKAEGESTPAEENKEEAPKEESK